MEKVFSKANGEGFVHKSSCSRICYILYSLFIESACCHEEVEHKKRSFCQLNKIGISIHSSIVPKGTTVIRCLVHTYIEEITKSF